MHEREKAAARIDVIAAGINHEAAGAAELIDEPRRSAESSGRLLGGSLLGPQEGNDYVEREVGRLRHDADLLDQMAEEVDRIRESAAALQRLSGGMRFARAEA